MKIDPCERCGSPVTKRARKSLGVGETGRLCARCRRKQTREPLEDWLARIKEDDPWDFAPR